MVVIGKGVQGDSDRLQTGSSILVLHEFYTDYDAKNKNKQFTVVDPKSDLYPFFEKRIKKNPESWWKFKTNLDQDDFSFVMTESQIKSFLNKMWEIYRYRKVN